MATELINISLPPKMARFIRAKVRDGQYTDASEVVRDAVRHMQEADEARTQQALLADFEAGLSESEHTAIRRGVEKGIGDIEAGRFEEYDAHGLTELAKELVATSRRRYGSLAKAR